MKNKLYKYSYILALIIFLSISGISFTAYSWSGGGHGGGGWHGNNGWRGGNWNGRGWYNWNRGNGGAPAYYYNNHGYYYNGSYNHYNNYYNNCRSVSGHYNSRGYWVPGGRAC